MTRPDVAARAVADHSGDTAVQHPVARDRFLQSRCGPAVCRDAVAIGDCADRYLATRSALPVAELLLAETGTRPAAPPPPGPADRRPTPRGRAADSSRSRAPAAQNDPRRRSRRTRSA